MKNLHTRVSAIPSFTKLICQACELATQIQKEQGEPLQKEDSSPVTAADFAVQILLTQGIQELFPQDPIVAEEDGVALSHPKQKALLKRVCGALHPYLSLSEKRALELLAVPNEGAVKEERFWVIDPIDGTKGFVRGEQFAVACALIQGGEPILGFLGCPRDQSSLSNGKGVLYWAQKGKGAWAQNLKTGREESLGKREPVMRFCCSVESGHGDYDEVERVAQALGICVPSVRLDGQGKYGMVAVGEAAAYLRLPRTPAYKEKIWDHAAGVLIVEESGGRVMDVEGKALNFGVKDFRLTENKGIVACGRQVQKELVKVMGELR